MTESEQTQILEEIGRQIASVGKEIEELTELTRPVSLDASIGRVSRMDAINNKAINKMALREKRAVLQRLERARERADDGTLGTCGRCGGEIPFGRLKFMPYTTRCVTCAARG